MTRTLRALCVALALVSVAVPARAQAPSNDARAAARELIESTKMGDLLEQMMGAMLPSLVDIFAQQNPGARAGVERAMREVVLPAIREERAGLLAIFEELYVRHFTADELRDVAAFYRTPTGRKSLEILPKLNAESMAMGAEWGRQAVTRAVERNREELRRRGINL